MTKTISVEPSQIQKELNKLEEAHKENRQQRACLFNLIVYTFKSDRLPFFKQIVDQITAQFPCRILFIEEDQQNEHPHLTTSITAKLLNSGPDKTIICEQIHVQTPSTLKDQVYPLILPHIIPDLPIYLFWASDPTTAHPLFASFQHLAHRLIFESECSNQLQDFSSKMLSNILNHHWEVADLNWVRSISWRKVIKGLFNTEQRLKDLMQASQITLKFAGTESEYFAHNHFQVHYLHAWLAAQLGWKPTAFTASNTSKKIVYKSASNNIQVDIQKEMQHEGIEAGSITSMEITMRNQKKFTATSQAQNTLIKIEFLDEKKPTEAYNTFLMHAKWEYSLSKEICYQETSKHYCNMLSILSKIGGLS